MSRRTYSRRVAIGAMAAAFAPVILPWDLRAGSDSGRRAIRFGVCADVHKDVMHDVDGRMLAFVDKANESRVDFILQLGDFCVPKEANRSMLKIWESFKGPRYHVLGNHDIDGKFTWDQTLKFWGMARHYYSFDQNGWHFVILDGNEKKPAGRAAGYPRYIGAEQLKWLAGDLAGMALPTVVFSHQSLEDPEGIENAEEVRKVLEAANARAGWAMVGACFSGHHHIDYQTQINGIYYIQINSMSYSWLGGKYACVRYGAENDKAYPFIKYTAPYRDPLFALVSLSPEGELRIEGRKSEFVGASPWELGLADQPGTSRCRDRLVPRISDRRMEWKPG